MKDNRGLILKINKSVDAKKVPLAMKSNRYAEVYAAVHEAGGEWIEVTMDTIQNAERLKQAAAQHRSMKIDTRIDGRSVFLRVVGTMRTVALDDER